MRALRRSLAPSLLVLLALACSSRARQPEDDGVHVSVAPSLIFPHGVLDNVATLELSVYEGDGLGCNADGTTTGVTSSTARIADTQLGTTACAGGATFCGTLSISKSDAPRLFSATAKASSGDLIANGCAMAVVNEDTVAVAVKMVRYVPAAVCDGKKVDPTEQCEDTQSDCHDCHTVEVALSDPGATVADPFFLWPAQAGEPLGRFFAFYTQSTGGSNLDVAMRLLSDSFGTVSGPLAAENKTLVLPNDPNAFPPKSMPNDQSLPAAVASGGTYYVAFRDTDNGTPDIHLRSFDSSLNALQSTAIGINGDSGGGESGIQTLPSLAAGPGALYVAWEDDTGPTSPGQVVGRKYAPATGIAATQNQISTGSQNRNVKVAATANGFLAVWESGSDIKLRAIDANGTPSGGEQVVNDPSLHQGQQDHPSIAALGDGRVCVAWADHGAAGGADIFVQRYDKDLNKVAGDQATRINDVVSTGDQTSPVVAAMAAAGGAFVVAWVDASTKHVRARLLGGSGGFLFNNVDGQNSEFQASVVDGRTRANPTIAVGGAAPFIAIGWQDQTSGSAGIYARRFPAPTQ